MPVQLKKDMTILFQGDSITDCFRGSFGCGEMGGGYASMASAELSERFPELKPAFINRGISGDCIEDLYYRWQRDCLDLKPDIVSILVGINNVRQEYEGLRDADNSTFYTTYYQILQRTRETVNPQFIICEPFLLNVSKQVLPLRKNLDEKIKIIKKLAEEFRAVFVPFDTLFTEASKKAKPSHWAPDGVHPTPAGHTLMAREWVAQVIGT